jgi:hypothetical protein
MNCLRSKYEKQLTPAERILSKKEFLVNRLPVGILIITGIFGVLDGLTVIAFGVLAIVYKSPLWYVGVG